MNESKDKSDLLAQTVEIVASYVSHNTVNLNDLPRLIEETHAALRAQNGYEGGDPERPRPAVPVKKSVTPDYIVCLEDGKKLKMLKRHLKTHYDMTPDDYRRRWGLKDDYPMVAPAYAETRSALAKKIGLGRKPEPKKAPRKRAARKPAAKKG